MKVQYVFGRIWLTSASPAFQKTHPIYNSRQQQDLQATWPQKYAVRRGERAWYSSNSENAMKIGETVVQSFRHCGIPTPTQEDIVLQILNSLHATLPAHINEQLKGLRRNFYLGRRDNRRNAECISR
jgi:hypothetical protein